MWDLVYVTFMTLSIIIFALETVDVLRGPLHPNVDNATGLSPEQRELFSQPLKVKVKSV
jgi:hypothetical protein